MLHDGNGGVAQTEVDGQWQSCTGLVKHRICLQGDSKNLVQWCTGMWHCRTSAFRLVTDIVAAHFSSWHHHLHSLPKTDWHEYVTWVPRCNNVIADIGSKRARLQGPYCKLYSNKLDAYVVGVWDGAFGAEEAGCAAAVYTSQCAPGGQIDSTMCKVLEIGIRCSAWSAQQAEAVALLLLTRSVSDLLLGRKLVNIFQIALSFA